MKDAARALLLLQLMLSFAAVCVCVCASVSLTQSLSCSILNFKKCSPLSYLHFNSTKSMHYIFPPLNLIYVNRQMSKSEKYGLHCIGMVHIRRERLSHGQANSNMAECFFSSSWGEKKQSNSRKYCMNHNGGRHVKWQILQQMF